MGDPLKCVELVGSECGTNNSDSTRSAASRTAQRVGKWEWERAIRDSDLRPTVLFVCLMVGTYMDADGEAFPSALTIQAKCGYKSDATVRKALREAVTRGYLIKVKGGGRAVGGGGRTNRYLSSVPNLVPTDQVGAASQPGPQGLQPGPQSPSNLVPTDKQTDQEQTKEQTSRREDEATQTFLDHIANANGVKTATRDRLTQERADPANRAKLGRITAHLAKSSLTPSRMARTVLDSADLNTVEHSLLGMILDGLKRNQGRTAA